MKIDHITKEQFDEEEHKREIEKEENKLVLVSVRIPKKILRLVEAYRNGNSITNSEAIRQLLEEGFFSSMGKG